MTTHQMTLISREGDFDTFYCPTCGRKFKLRWQPYKRIILVPGDDTVNHAAAIGGMAISASVEDTLEAFRRYLDGRIE